MNACELKQPYCVCVADVLGDGSFPSPGAAATIDFTIS